MAAWSSNHQDQQRREQSAGRRVLPGTPAGISLLAPDGLPIAYTEIHSLQDKTHTFCTATILVIPATAERQWGLPLTRVITAMSRFKSADGLDRIAADQRGPGPTGPGFAATVVGNDKVAARLRHRRRRMR